LARAEIRRLVDDLAATAHAMGELMLEVAPAYLSDHQAAEYLAPLCKEIDDDLDSARTPLRPHWLRR
jgi:hypothetical protein